ncbi:exoribonculease Dhp1 [Pyronema domesticum]|uniref:5'-3' exoribonuclease n=1 Tax=Pyronema omphalodes (strain CBS 100304) TaxID=1076935 RepID=U4L3A2_PYROM|nr:exoribonculease Dhp1 [Pyronema domesticum]CCX04525.1 Similar to 5' acc. no. Q5BFH3 [Pyronema omphalodes CBS 100304]
MGVPALFRWLSQKYPKIVSPVIEELPQEIDGVTVPVDTTKPNPNGEMDNLYLDMNGIVHPCSHPEDRPAPETEEEMMMAVFEYTDRVVNMVRPRKVLMIAVDGVAPRAKMNQQRSRRFRSAKEAQEKEDDTAALMILLEKQRGHKIDEELKGKKVWDSNAITPGTPFMDILAASLRYWCQYKLNTDPAWAKLKVIISDSTVPGEGEHKIMEFIRSQRGNPEHDPNTRHVIYGLDADLIMLGLGTHEPHFRVLREDVFAADKKQKGCQICGQTGHRAEECQGKAKQKSGEFDEKATTVNVSKKPFIWLHVGILREYLAVELDVKEQGFRFDLERAIDDWVFMCFFVGNDFLPHLPSLEIRDGGIDTLMAIWKDNLPVMGGYLTKDGSVELDKVQYILDGLAKQEDAIFRRRKQGEDRREENAKRRKLQEQGRNGRANTNDRPGYEDAVMSAPSNRRKVPDSAPPPMIPLMKPGDLSAETKKLNYDMVMNREGIRKANLQNKSAAAVLKAQLASGKLEVAAESPVNGAETESESATPADGEAAVAPVTPAKRKADEVEAEDAAPAPKKDAEMPPDTVRLWEPGYRDRYYEQKFHVNADDHEFRHKVAAAYVEGLCWVLRYYFQGCPSWDWYYPYHYAPFAQDFKDVGKLEINFTHGTIFKPFEQLMGVLPAASKHTLPTPFHKLMTDENSEIIEFYPENFPIDLNGKKFAWQGVALLPFIDEKRLLAAIQKVYPQLTPEDLARNELGRDTLLISDGHPLYDDVVNRFYSKKADVTKYKISMRTSEGLAGGVEKDPSFIPRSTLTFPLATGGMPDLDNDRTMSLFYDLPKTKNIHKSMLLRGVRLDPPTLNRGDIEMTRSRAEGRGRSYGGAQLYRGRGNHNGSFRSDRGGHGGYNNNRGDDRGDNRGGNWGNNNNYNNNRNQGGYPAQQDGTIPPPSTGGWGGSWGGAPQGAAYGLPPPPGQFGRGGYPQPPPGVRDGGSYVGPPPGQGDNRRGGGYNNNRGGRGGNQNRNRGNGGQGGGYEGYGWSGKSY